MSPSWLIEHPPPRSRGQRHPPSCPPRLRHRRRELPINRPPASSRAVPVAVLSVVAVLVALLTGGGATSASAHVDRQHADHGQHAAHHLTAQQVAFHDQMRKLWEDHVTWTRLAIVTFADGSQGFPATAGRLLQNQVDLGNA